MKLFKNPKLCHLQAELSRASDLYNKREPAQALEVYRAANEELKRLGASSAFTLWNMAIAADQIGDLPMAFDLLVQTLALDPLAAPFRNSFDIITRRIREALSAPDRRADDPSTPRLYELLARAGEADVPAHVAMARYCAATGDMARAQAIADAMIALHSMEREAWLCKADLARAVGELDEVAECAAEAAALEGEPVPFAMPGVAQG
jgi:tetratricopeptide (TPR) repeat protein